ncbi:unnamed protein product, partial [marine sediment metagenome]
MKKDRRHLPKKKERYDIVTKLYNAFTVKDMTLKEFRIAYERETSPRNMKKELKELVRFRSHQRTQGAVA